MMREHRRRVLARVSRTEDDQLLRKSMNSLWEELKRYKGAFLMQGIFLVWVVAMLIFFK